MKPTILKIFIIAFISIIGIPIRTEQASGCAGDDSTSDDWLYSFFSPRLAKANNAFFLSYHFMNESDASFYDYKMENTTEWKDYFNSLINENDIEILVYEFNVSQVDSLIRYINGDYKVLAPYTIYAHALLSNKKKVVSALNYLRFAKRCEPFVAFDLYDWKEKEKKDTSVLLQLIRESEIRFKNASGSFFKLREGFQLLRLYYFARAYRRGIDLYEKKLALIKSNSSIKVRALGYVASCYYASKDFAHANYIYSQIYNNNPKNQVSAMYSFHPQEESDWQATLALTKNVDEKVTLWEMLGYYADPLRAMKEIYKLDPQSGSLELLLGRAINSEEQYLLSKNKWLGDDSDHNGYGGVYAYIGFDPTRNAQPLYDFVKEVVDNKKASNLKLWMIAQGYLIYLRGEPFDQATQLFKAARQSGASSEEEAQIRTTELLNMISGIGNIDKATEDKLYDEINRFKQLPGLDEKKLRFALSYIFHELSDKYRKQKDIVKAEICSRFDMVNPELYQKFYLMSKNADTMLAFMRRRDKNDWEKMLLTSYGIKENNILEWQAIRLTYEDRPEEAIKKLNESAVWEDLELYSDPFLIHIKDCHDCDHEAPGARRVGKYEFIKKLAGLETELKKADKKDISSYAFELGNGFYNISYYGNARLFYDSKISDELDFTDGTVFFYEFSDGQSQAKKIKSVLDIFSCEKSKKYYQLALDNAPNKEVAAKCCWMIAKCELNEYYQTLPSNDNVDFVAGKHMKILHEKYSDTNYYRDVINECGYFKTYINKRR